MADQPALQSRAVGLGVELQRQHLFAPGERLVRAQRARGQQRRTFRQVELVAVPVQYRPFRQRHQCRPASRLGQRDRREADFLVPHPPDPRAARRGDELRAEAHGQQWPLRAEAPLDQLQLLDEERVAVVLVGADRSAEHDQQVGRERVHRAEVGDRRIDVVDRPAVRLEPRVPHAEILEHDMADHRDARHPRPAFRVSARANARCARWRVP